MMKARLGVSPIWPIRSPAWCSFQACARRQEPAVARNDAVVAVDQDRVGPAELADRGSDLRDLSINVRAFFANGIRAAAGRYSTARRRTILMVSWIENDRARIGAAAAATEAGSAS